MKVLLVSNKNPSFPTITDFVEDAIMEFGHRPIFFDDRRHVFPGFVRARIPAAAALDLHSINRHLVNAVRRVAPDLVLVLGGSRIFPETVSSVETKGVVTILWTVDPPVDFKPERAAAPRYHQVFCGGTEAVEILTRDGVEARWLPFACDPKSYCPVPVTDAERAEFGSDIVFVGSFYPNRWEILRQLAEFNLTIWGPGWKRAGCDESGRIRIHDAQLHFETQRKIYAASKIALVIHLQDGRTPCHQASPKVYEAMACGAFVVCDRQRDVFSLFRDRKHLAGFDNIADLKAQLRYFLDRPDERRAIADGGRREVGANHKYADRIKMLLERTQPNVKQVV